MLLLAIDTSAALSVALSELHLSAAPLVLTENADPQFRMHVELLAPMVHDALTTTGVAMSALDGIVVGTGPGPFTGLRVGIATGRALALALDIPTYGLPSLDALAWEAAAMVGDTQRDILVATDARRKEVYSATYRIAKDDVVRVGDFAVGQAIDAAAKATEGTVVIGQGAALYPEAFPTAEPDGPRYPRAAHLAYLAATRTAAGQDLTTLEALEPLYLRRPDVHAPGPRKRAS